MIRDAPVSFEWNRETARAMLAIAMTAILGAATSGGARPATPARAAPAEPAVRPTLACPAPVGDAEPLLVRGATLVFGEIHGTQQAPAAFASIACAAASKLDVVVGLEIPRAEQPTLDAYLASDGGAAARARLLAGPFWNTTFRDGRSSEAIAAVVDHVRAWRAAGARVELVAFDVSDPELDDPARRDRGMREPLIAARRAHPDGALLVLTGNLHARLAAGGPIEPEVTRMAEHLARAIPGVASFDLAYGRGTAWVCTGPSPADCGETPWGQGDDPGPTRITADRVVDDAGRTVYSGHLHVGAIAASRPAAP